MRHTTNRPATTLVLGLLLWIPIAATIGLMAGSASAILLISLARATEIREAHPWLIALLPLAGLAVGLLYRYTGQSVEAGNNLILDQLHAEAEDPAAVIPLRMTPLILIGTILTHLSGGSAGREGTAIQTGASLADQLCRPLRLSFPERRIVLMMGISAGFASVFGTPLAGTLFGLEVATLGTLSYEALAPCLLAAFFADFTTRAWHVRHTLYTVDTIPALTLRTLFAAILAGVAFGLMALAFARLTHALKHLAARLIPWPPLRPFVGGTILALFVFTLGYAHTSRFLGLGIPHIVAAFHQPIPPAQPVSTLDFAIKTLFTALTLGSGFKGGEVTPLFYIGATLGNALAHILPLPSTLLAGMGFVAVFAGAANTPISSTLMAFELFGAEAGTFAAIACVLSYLCSGHTGIYTSQRIGHPKHASQKEPHPSG